MWGCSCSLFVVFFSNNIYFALLICIEHCFTNIELYTLYIYTYVGTVFLMYIYVPIINPAHSNVRAYDVGLVLSSPTRTKSPDLSELLRSLIISRAFPPISSIVLPVPYAKKYTSVKRAADWVIVSANTLGMLRLTIKTLLNQSRDISTSRTILKNTWRFVVFPSQRI